MARSPITPLVVEFQNLTPDEQKIFLDLVDPQPEPETSAKQTRKKRGASKKAQSLSSAIRGATGKMSGADANDDDGSDPTLLPTLCSACGNEENFTDHFKPSPNYHAFEAPKAKKASAQK